ncbi:hypothetical protein HELRODRAFT_173320 [Helobdella robusta]|uniref:Uncharacterized protein n=1 Tax=Helobdella robusta TaxID=6412 RepID=T1F6P0_HELRO|nr:hypothetical protein HELRODRAFT_173320 [Helobdella robusta]ESO03626.1 hypothetical protein HELRODRAFT_173320 [Helobdella robusta]
MEKINYITEDDDKDHRTDDDDNNIGDDEDADDDDDADDDGDGNDADDDGDRDTLNFNNSDVVDYNQTDLEYTNYENNKNFYHSTIKNKDTICDQSRTNDSVNDDKIELDNGDNVSNEGSFDNHNNTDIPETEMFHPHTNNQAKNPDLMIPPSISVSQSPSKNLSQPTTKNFIPSIIHLLPSFPIATTTTTTKPRSIFLATKNNTTASTTIQTFSQTLTKPLYFSKTSKNPTTTPPKTNPPATKSPSHAPVATKRTTQTTNSPGKTTATINFSNLVTTAAIENCKSPENNSPPTNDQTTQTSKKSPASQSPIVQLLTRGLHTYKLLHLPGKIPKDYNDDDDDDDDVDNDDDDVDNDDDDIDSDDDDEPNSDLNDHDCIADNNIKDVGMDSDEIESKNFENETQIADDDRVIIETAPDDINFHSESITTNLLTTPISSIPGPLRSQQPPFYPTPNFLLQMMLTGALNSLSVGSTLSEENLFETSSTTSTQSQTISDENSFSPLAQKHSATKETELTKSKSKSTKSFSDIQLLETATSDVVVNVPSFEFNAHLLANNNSRVVKATSTPILYLTSRIMPPTTNTNTTATSITTEQKSNSPLEETTNTTTSTATTTTDATTTTAAAAAAAATATATITAKKHDDDDNDKDAKDDYDDGGLDNKTINKPQKIFLCSFDNRALNCISQSCNKIHTSPFLINNFFINDIYTGFIKSIIINKVNKSIYKGCHDCKYEIDNFDRVYNLRDDVNRQSGQCKLDLCKCGFNKDCRLNDILSTNQSNLPTLINTDLKNYISDFLDIDDTPANDSTLLLNNTLTTANKTLDTIQINAAELNDSNANIRNFKPTNCNVNENKKINIDNDDKVNLENKTPTKNVDGNEIARKTFSLTGTAEKMSPPTNPHQTIIPPLIYLISATKTTTPKPKTLLQAPLLSKIVPNSRQTTSTKTHPLGKKASNRVSTSGFSRREPIFKLLAKSYIPSQPHKKVDERKNLNTIKNSLTKTESPLAKPKFSKFDKNNRQDWQETAKAISELSSSYTDSPTNLTANAEAKHFHEIKSDQTKSLKKFRISQQKSTESTPSCSETANLCTEVMKNFLDNHHSTRVRPLCYNKPHYNEVLDYLKKLSSRNKLITNSSAEKLKSILSREFFSFNLKKNSTADISESETRISLSLSSSSFLLKTTSTTIQTESSLSRKHNSATSSATSVATSVATSLVPSKLSRTTPHLSQQQKQNSPEYVIGNEKKYFDEQQEKYSDLHFNLFQKMQNSEQQSARLLFQSKHTPTNYMIRENVDISKLARPQNFYLQQDFRKSQKMMSEKERKLNSPKNFKPQFNKIQSDFFQDGEKISTHSKQQTPENYQLKPLKRYRRRVKYRQRHMKVHKKIFKIQNKKIQKCFQLSKSMSQSHFQHCNQHLQQKHLVQQLQHLQHNLEEQANREQEQFFLQPKQRTQEEKRENFLSESDEPHATQQNIDDQQSHNRQKILQNKISINPFNHFLDSSKHSQTFASNSEEKQQMKPQSQSQKHKRQHKENDNQKFQSQESIRQDLFPSTVISSQEIFEVVSQKSDQNSATEWTDSMADLSSPSTSDNTIIQKGLNIGDESNENTNISELSNISPPTDAKVSNHLNKQYDSFRRNILEKSQTKNSSLNKKKQQNEKQEEQIEKESQKHQLDLQSKTQQTQQSQGNFVSKVNDREQLQNEVRHNAKKQQQPTPQQLLKQQQNSTEPQQHMRPIDQLGDRQQHSIKREQRSVRQTSTKPPRPTRPPNLTRPHQQQQPGSNIETAKLSTDFSKISENSFQQSQNIQQPYFTLNQHPDNVSKKNKKNFFKAFVNLIKKPSKKLKLKQVSFNESLKSNLSTDEIKPSNQERIICEADVNQQKQTSSGKKDCTIKTDVKSEKTFIGRILSLLVRNIQKNKREVRFNNQELQQPLSQRRNNEIPNLQVFESNLTKNFKPTRPYDRPAHTKPPELAAAVSTPTTAAVVVITSAEAAGTTSIKAVTTKPVSKAELIQSTFERSFFKNRNSLQKLIVHDISPTNFEFLTTASLTPRSTIINSCSRLSSFDSIFNTNDYRKNDLKRNRVRCLKLKGNLIGDKDGDAKFKTFHVSNKVSLTSQYDSNAIGVQNHHCRTKHHVQDEAVCSPGKNLCKKGKPENAIQLTISSATFKMLKSEYKTRLYINDGKKDKKTSDEKVIDADRDGEEADEREDVDAKIIVEVGDVEEKVERVTNMNCYSRNNLKNIYKRRQFQQNEHHNLPQDNHHQFKFFPQQFHWSVGLPPRDSAMNQVVANDQQIFIPKPVTNIQQQFFQQQQQQQLQQQVLQQQFIMQQQRETVQQCFPAFPPDCQAPCCIPPLQNQQRPPYFPIYNDFVREINDQYDYLHYQQHQQRHYHYPRLEQQHHPLHYLPQQNFYNQHQQQSHHESHSRNSCPSLFHSSVASLPTQYKGSIEIIYDKKENNSCIRTQNFTKTADENAMNSEKNS